MEITGAAATGAAVTTGAIGAGFSTAAATTGVLPETPMEASRAPTATVESTGTSIVNNVPVTGDGISVSTLSVETSSSASSAFI